ncbi:MAG: class I SAM-dependent DNA methyltransferase [Candidatus Hermodarchaeota archaeon]
MHRKSTNKKISLEKERNTLGTIQSRLLTPESLRQDFAFSSPIFKELILVLANCLVERLKEGNLTEFREWTEIFEIIYGTKIENESEILRYFSPLFQGCTSLKEALFILQTYLAIIIKFLALELLAQLRGQKSLLSQFLSLSNLSLLQKWKTLNLKEYFLQFYLEDFLEEYFDWIFLHASKDLMPPLKKLFVQLQTYDYQITTSAPLYDLFKALYLELIPQKVRKTLGEYYTPDWLTQHLISISGYAKLQERILDPCCGSGTFLLACLDLIKSQFPEYPPDESTFLLILNNIVGFEINPISVLMARFNYLYALKDFFRYNSRMIRLPIFKVDTLQLALSQDFEDPKNSSFKDLPIFQAFDFVIGNPPWIQFEFLSEKYRQITQKLWNRYLLLESSKNNNTSGRVARGNTDLSLLFTYVSVDFYLELKGVLAFVITQKIFQIDTSGERFRRFFIDTSHTFLNIKQVQDLTTFQPFPQTSNKTALLILQKDELKDPEPPRYIKWKRRPGFKYKFNHSLKDMLAGFELEEMQVQFLGGRSSAQWQIFPKDSKYTFNLYNDSNTSFYRAQGGVHPAGASGIYILKKEEEKSNGLLRVKNQPNQGKKLFQEIGGIIESEHVYPLVRGRDIRRWAPAPKYYFLLPHSPSTGTKEIPRDIVSQETPLTFEYLLNFEKELSSRKKKRVRAPHAEFYHVLDVRENQFAPIKVVWRRMGNDLIVGVCEPQKVHSELPSKPILPLETVVYVPLETREEAHFLCALLNSKIVRIFIKSFSPPGRGFATPSVLSKLKIPKFSLRNPYHQKLAFLSIQAHQIQEKNRSELEAIESKIEEVTRLVFQQSL